jgi:predicted AAA+ superfamily ATPase
LFEKGPLCGPIFENYLVLEIFKDIKHKNRDTRLFYFRSNLGRESDLIIEDRINKRVIFSEIKYNKTARPKMVENIKILLEKEKEYQVHAGYDISGLLLYNGDGKGSYFGSIYYMPWSSFLKQKV